MDFDNMNQNNSEEPSEDEAKFEAAPSESRSAEPAAPAISEAAYISEPAGVQTNTPQESRTNEYIYNNFTPAPKKKKGNGGKIALGIIASLLAVFVISVTSISAYIAFSGGSLGYQQEGESSDADTDSNSFIIPPNPADKTDEKPSDKQDESESQSSKDNRTFPTIEQLASPEDAMYLPDIYDKVSPSVVGVSCTLSRGSATGTGIIISKDGYIITNAHVIEGAVSVMIVDSELNEYEASIIGYDTQTDLAVLKIEASDLQPCEFGISGDLRIGELAVVIGNPLGFELYGTMTNGIISGLNRTITIGDKKMTLIQTNASINNGNSGGPLINSYGQVIGITSAKVASIYGEGLGFAIPIDEALPIIDDLIKYGYVTGRPLIGITGEDLSSIISMYYRIPQGVYVRFVTPDSGADKAGIKAGDIIIGVNGEAITKMDELTAIKNNFSAGDTITLTVYRDNKNIDIDVVLSEVTQENEQ